MFVELTGKHAVFHRAAGEVARQINAGRYADAERLLGSGSRFAEISTDVVGAIGRAAQRLGRH